jgi:ABC-2 type transport system permease protein
MRMLAGQVALEIKLFLRRKDEIFWTLAFPVFFIVLFGLLYRDTEWTDQGLRAIDYILPGIVVMAVMVTGIMSTANGFVEERDKGIYRRLSLTPLKKHALIGGQIVNRYLIILVQALILIIIGVTAFKVDIVGNYALFWFALTMGAVCFLTVGFALTGLIKNAKSSTPITMIAFFVLLFLGGVFFPVDMMPGFLQAISSALPSTHLNDALRTVGVEGGGSGDIWIDIAVLGGWTVGCLGLSIRFFKWE